MAYPVQIDQTEQGLDRLPFVLQDKENWTKMIQLFMSKIDEIEDALYEILTERGINEAIGFQLDLIGKILGVGREGRDDEAYRTALLTDIAVRAADGTPNVIINLVKNYTNALSVKLTESAVAFGTISTNGDTNIGADLWELVDNIRPAGTRWLIHSDYNDNAFLLAYELTLQLAEAFQTTDDGVFFENFQTRDTPTGDFETFFTYLQSTSYYEPSLITGRNSWYYEGNGENFEVSLDGVSTEQFFLSSNYANNAFAVVPEIEPVPDNVLPLHWEVNETSNNIE